MAYQCKRTEDVGVVDFLPFIHGRLRDPLHGGENGMVNDQAVQSAEGLDGEVRDFGGNLWDISISLSLCSRYRAAARRDLVVPGPGREYVPRDQSGRQQDRPLERGLLP